jgi:hypothetical protein
MSSPMTRRSGSNHLVAVFPDRRAADEAREALVHLGIADDDVVIGDSDDHVASLRAEMRGELSGGVKSALPFIPTRRGARGFGAVAAIGTVIALVAAVPLAFIDIGGAYWVRYLFIAAFLCLLAWVYAVVIGTGMGVNRPEEQMAAERGVTLQAPSTPEARADLERRHPIRLDEVDATGEPVRVVAQDAGEGDGAARGGVRENITTDDFSPPPGPNTADQ